MGSELGLRRKWTFRASGAQVVFVKRRNERTEHVIMKALLWALYLPQYPDLAVEIPIGDRYRPDVVQLDLQGIPVFWGEAGHVSPRKVRSLAKRYRSTHFAWGKWDVSLDTLTSLVCPELEGVKRQAPFDLIAFPRDSVERFIRHRRSLDVSLEDLDWVRIED
jgi:hypothetical protein